MKFYRLLFLCLLPLMALTGCMTMPQEVALENYQGRFSVAVEDSYNQVSERGRFELVLFPKDHIVLDLKTPLGGTVARIEKTKEKARLKALGHETVEADNIEQLLFKTLGFSIPIEGLPYWIKGQANPSTPFEVEPQQAPFNRIEQNGWTIEIVSRSSNQSPKRIRMSRVGTVDRPAIHLTLLILESN